MFQNAEDSEIMKTTFKIALFCLESDFSYHDFFYELTINLMNRAVKNKVTGNLSVILLVCERFQNKYEAGDKEYFRYCLAKVSETKRIGLKEAKVSSHLVDTKKLADNTPKKKAKTSKSGLFRCCLPFLYK